MADYSVGAGKSTYGNTLSTTDADTVTFPARYGYMTVTNLDTGNALYVTADGSTPSGDAGEEGSYVVPPGDSRIISNGAGIWYQSSRCMIPGSDNANGQSKGAQLTNPETVISLVGSGNAYVIEAAG